MRAALDSLGVAEFVGDTVGLPPIASIPSVPNSVSGAIVVDAAVLDPSESTSGVVADFARQSSIEIQVNLLMKFSV